MKKSSLVQLIIVVLLIAGVGYLALAGVTVGNYDVLPWPQAVKLGLDLRGGVYAVYQAKNQEATDFDAKMDSVISIMQTRLDGQGYTEATVVRQGANRVRVEVPDVQDPNQILEILGQPAKLVIVDPDGNLVIEGADIKSAVPAYGEGNVAVVQFELNDSGTKAFADATTKFKGEKLSIILDDVLISDPTVNEAILNGKGIITNMDSVEQARILAGQIESGALPLDMEQIELRNISATLGADALERCLFAGVLGTCVVLLFMLVYYRLPGIVADMALLVYLIMVLFALVTIPGVQLTLPGIAGIILSIGMAVDANVVIFERIREELRAGKSVRAASDAGFKKGFTAVLDSNITTLIAAAVLWYFGTGSIKGFGITLFIGIVCSMVTAVAVTRYLLKLFIGLNFRKPSLYGIKTQGGGVK